MDNAKQHKAHACWFFSFLHMHASAGHILALSGLLHLCIMCAWQITNKKIHRGKKHTKFVIQCVRCMQIFSGRCLRNDKLLKKKIFKDDNEVSKNKNVQLVTQNWKWHLISVSISLLWLNDKKNRDTTFEWNFVANLCMLWEKILPF